MAVAEPAPASARIDRQPRAREFVRLKLRLLGNTFRGQTVRVIGFAVGLGLGILVAGAGMMGLAATAYASPEVGYLVAVFAGSALVLAWALVPLLFFGIDETLDPARFALLPIRRGALVRGMLAASFVGVPAFASLVATTGLAMASWQRFGTVAGLTALAGVVAGVALGIIASRALTSAFAALLRSRRVRDLAAAILALLAASIGPIQWVVAAAVERGSLSQALRVAEVLAWTPFGAPYAVPYDVAGGRWDLALIRVAIVAATMAILLAWWSRTIESAMLVSGSGGLARAATIGANGAVSELLPGWLRRFVQPGPYGAIMARELRFWWRDGRRRPALVSIVVASAVVPIAISLTGSGDRPSVAGGALVVGGFSFAVTMSGTLTGMLLCNQFGFDGTAYVSHLFCRVPGTLELRARAAAIAVIIVPVQIAVVIGVCVLADAVPYLPMGFGVLATSAGAGLATAAVLSVLAPYALPENQNPFSTNMGSGSAKGLFAFLALLVTLILSTPISVAAVLVPSPAWGWVILVAGLVYGLVLARVGTYIAGDLLDRRGPEVLIAVTPRR